MFQGVSCFSFLRFFAQHRHRSTLEEQRPDHEFAFKHRYDKRPAALYTVQKPVPSQLLVAVRFLLSPDFSVTHHGHHTTPVIGAGRRPGG